MTCALAVRPISTLCWDLYARVTDGTRTGSPGHSRRRARHRAGRHPAEMARHRRGHRLPPPDHCAALPSLCPLSWEATSCACSSGPPPSNPQRTAPYTQRTANCRAAGDGDRLGVDARGPCRRRGPPDVPRRPRRRRGRRWSEPAREGDRPRTGTRPYVVKDIANHSGIRPARNAS